MKKTLTAIALTALFASSAAAEDIELYKEITNNAGETVPLRYCYDSEGIAVRLRMSNRPNPMDPNYWGAFSSLTAPSSLSNELDFLSVLNDICISLCIVCYRMLIYLIYTVL